MGGPPLLFWAEAFAFSISWTRAARTSAGAAARGGVSDEGAAVGLRQADVAPLPASPAGEAAQPSHAAGDRAVESDEMVGLCQAPRICAHARCAIAFLKAGSFRS